MSSIAWVRGLYKQLKDRLFYRPKKTPLPPPIACFRVERTDGSGSPVTGVVRRRRHD